MFLKSSMSLSPKKESSVLTVGFCLFQTLWDSWAGSEGGSGTRAGATKTETERTAACDGISREKLQGKYGPTTQEDGDRKEEPFERARGDASTQVEGTLVWAPEIIRGNVQVWSCLTSPLLQMVLRKIQDTVCFDHFSYPFIREIH